MDAEELPWRPLTAGELLDTAIAVFRHQPARLLGVSVVLATLEQVALYPLRHGMFGNPHNYFTSPDGFAITAAWWRLLAYGIGTEAVVLGLLGAVAAGPARQLLLARAPGACPRMSLRPVGAILLSLVIGLVAFAAFWLAVVPWVFWFMFTGLVMPVLVTDARLGAGPGRPARKLSVPGALFRSFGLVGRSGLRPGAIRLLAYGPFTVLRLLLGFGGTLALAEFVHVPPAASYAVWIVVNATVYACLAAVDATTHLETRMRLEGLDMELNRAVRGGIPIADALVVPR
jgi:hypothetical protein